MGYNGCKEIALEFIEEASEKFGSDYVVNKEKLEKFDKVCEDIDILVENCTELQAIDVVTDENLGYSFVIVVEELVIENSYLKKFVETIRNFDTFDVRKTKDGNIRMEFTIHDFWISKNFEK